MTAADTDARDVLAQDLVLAVEALALTVRGRDPAAIRQEAQQILARAGDPRAALIVAAALIPVDQAFDPWWLPPAQRVAEKGYRHREALAAAIGASDDYRPSGAGDA